MKKKIIPTSKQFEIMKEYWAMFTQEQGLFYGKIRELERKMSKDVGIEDLEFFMVEGDVVGIGDYNRKMKLIHDLDLENDDYLFT